MVVTGRVGLGRERLQLGVESWHEDRENFDIVAEDDVAREVG